MKFVFVFLAGLALWLSPNLSFGDCEAALSSLSQPALQKQIETEFSSFFDQIPKKAAQRISKNISRSIRKEKISEVDLYNATQSFYDALQGNLWKRIQSGFSQDKGQETLDLSVAFKKELDAFAHKNNIKLRDSKWIRAQLWMIQHRTPISWAKTIAFQGTMSFVTYQMTGNFLWVPVYFPDLYTPTFKEEKAKKAAYFYDRTFKSVITTYYALSLAFIVLKPDFAMGFYNQWHEYQAQTQQIAQLADEIKKYQ
jgi:hypothetical protein